MRVKKISDFLNTDYKDYSMSVIEERAIPSCIDSFKNVQRKIIDMAREIWKNGNEKPIKVFQLCGQTCAKKLYVHGDSSCNGAIINMCQTFKNNMPLLISDGQVGSLRVPSNASPRYVGCKLSQNFNLLYKDFELLENKIEEGQIIEPKWFLPIIPVILVDGGAGLAVGFASNILNRNPKDVIDNCILYLKEKKVKEMKPWLSEFNGDWVRDNENKNKWYIHGKYEISETKPEIHVTELPPDITFEKYESYLDDLIENRTIRDYDNNSSSGVDYVLKFKKEDFDSLIKDKEKLEKLLKINDSATENITTLDENNKLKIFNQVEEIIPYFVDFRINYYQKRKDYFINKWSIELREMCWRAKFIKSIIDKKLVVNNTPKEIIVSWLEENGFEKYDGSYNYLLDMKISNLTKEKYEELINKTKMKKEQIDEYSKKDIKEMYLEDLVELRKKIKS